MLTKVIQTWRKQRSERDRRALQRTLSRHLLDDIGLPDCRHSPATDPMFRRF